MPILEMVILVVTTVVIVYISRGSLRDPRSHGFYRAFAWEAILILIVLNLDEWFHDPWSWHQIVSWILLTVSFFLVIHVVQLLRSVGRPDPQRNDGPLLGLEKTTVLVTTGAYGFIRHPAYASLLFLAWGTFFKGPALTGGLLGLAATLFLVATARTEETENVRYFGPAYVEYMKRTRMFVPFVF